MLNLLIAVMIFKKVSGKIIFRSNKFIACKVKDEKEVAETLVAFNLLKIVRPFQGKNHLRIYLLKLKLQRTGIFNWLQIASNTNSSL